MTSVELTPTLYSEFKMNTIKYVITLKFNIILLLLLLLVLQQHDGVLLFVGIDWYACQDHQHSILNDPVSVS